MQKQVFKKVKSNLPLFVGIMGATIIGFLEGVGIETAITDQILKSIREGNIVGFMAYLMIFVLIWLQVRGLKIAVENLTNTIANSFAKGETRFTEIEHRQHLADDRLSVLESQIKGLLK